MDAPARLLRPARRLLRFALAWIVLPAAGLFAAVCAAYGMGYARYAIAGRPGHWSVTEASRVSQRFMAVSAPTASAQSLYARLGVGAREHNFLSTAGAGRWQLEAPGMLRRIDDPYRAAYRLDDEGFVSRVVLVLHGLDETRVRDANARMAQAWGQPRASAGTIPSTPRTHRIAHWEIDGARILVEHSDGARPGLWVMTVRMLGPSDPLYDAHPATGGLAPMHPLAADLAESLASGGPGGPAAAAMARAIAADRAAARAKEEADPPPAATRDPNRGQPILRRADLPPGVQRVDPGDR